MLLRVALVVSVLGLTAAPVVATDVTSCGQQIAAGDTADLTVDLDCSSGAFGIELGRHAALDLHGHTITMQSATAVAAITCLNGCVVDGPGALVHPRADLATDDPVDGIRVFKGRLVATELDISGFNEGVNANLAAGAKLTDVDAHGCSAIGIAGRRLTLANVTANDNGTVNPETFQQYGAGIGGGTIKGAGVTATNNVETGVAGANVTLTSALVTGSAIGVSGIVRVKLTDSSVTGAAVSDVRSAHKPKVVNTSCDHSSSTVPPLTSWGVCALD